MESKHLARKKGIFHYFDFALNLIWINLDYHPAVGNYVLVHNMNHSEDLGCDYFPCETIDQLNNVKSKILNLGFSIDWNQFNLALDHLTDQRRN